MNEAAVKKPVDREGVEYVNDVQHGAHRQGGLHQRQGNLKELVLSTILGFVLALILNNQFKGRKIARAIVVFPWATTLVIQASAWNFIRINTAIRIMLGAIQRYGSILRRAFAPEERGPCKFYPTAKSEWADVKQGVINVEQQALLGGNVQELLDGLQSEIAG